MSTQREVFIAKALRKHNTKYDYSKVEYINSRTPVTIICPIHGEFKQRPNNHLQGCGCQKCRNEMVGNRRRSNTDEFIEKAKTVHSNKYDYSKVKYVNNSTKACIICPIHGEFWQTPQNHLAGRGCPECSINKADKFAYDERRKNFIIKANKFHGEKYDYSKVEYKGAHTKVCIICPIHGEFWQTPHTHLRCGGCPKCVDRNKSRRYTKETFIAASIKKHGNKYDYSNVEFSTIKDKVRIICPIHGEFLQTATSHMNGSGCPMCGNEQKGSTRRLTQEEFIEKIKNVYGDIYDYSMVKYTDTYTNVKIKCPIHGVFEKKPIYLLRGNGCPLCRKQHYHQVRAYTTEEFISRAREVHDDKYDYSKSNYTHNKGKLIITCPIHGDFIQSPDKHLIGHGCPKCGMQKSNTEDELMDLLISYGLTVKRNTKQIINPYEIDIYIPSKKIAIEYDGLIWHSERFGKDKNYHLNKTNLCEKQGIRLIHIFEDEWLEHKDIVISKIKHILQLNTEHPKIFARNCEVKEIGNTQASEFLTKNHIQGHVRSSIYLGCFHKDELIGVMSFKKERNENNNWELTRFASDINRNCIGVGGKLFKYFQKNYTPTMVKTFADRRWSSILYSTIYDKLGFKKVKTLPPDYSYSLRDKKLHKFSCRKQKLLKQFPEILNDKMTENEMTKKLGYYKIWNCGLYKYVWAK